MPADLDHRSSLDPTLHRKLAGWVAASLITPSEADAIEEYEIARTQRGRIETSRRVPLATGAQRGRIEASRRVPLVTEALGYLGAVLALGAGAVLLADRWNDLEPVVHTVAIGVGALALLAAGWTLRRNDEPAMGRLASVLWALAVGLVVCFGVVLGSDVMETTDRAAGMIGGAAGFVIAGILYLARQRPLQQAAVALTLALTLGFVFSDDPTSSGVAWWVVGAAWFLFGLRGLLEPRWTAYGIGALEALIGAMVLAADAPGAGVVLGLGTAAAVVTASVLLHETGLLAIGVVGLFVFLVRGVTYFFRGTLGVPLALLAAGAVVLVVALVLARRSGATRTAPRSPS